MEYHKYFLFPDLDFKFEVDIELFFYSLFYRIDQSHDVTAFAAFFCDKKIRMFFADDRTADLQKHLWDF